MKIKIKDLLYYDTSNGRLYTYDGSTYTETGDSIAVSTAGDLRTYTTSGGGGEAVLGVGADGTVLMADSTQDKGIKWGTVGGGAYSNRIVVDSGGDGAALTVASGVLLAAALSPSATNRVAVVVTPGTYVELVGAPNVPIALPSWVDLIAMDANGGPSTTIIAADDPSVSTITVSSHNVIAGFEFPCNTDKVFTQGTVAALAGSCDDITVKNCRFVPYATTAVGYAININYAGPSANTNEPVLIQNCEFFSGYSGASFTSVSGININGTGVNLIIDNCTFDREEYATAVQLNTCKGSVKNCTFKNNVNSNSFKGVVCNLGSEVTIHNNVFDNMHTGILVSDSFTGTDVIIDGCIFKNITVTAAEYAIAVTGSAAIATIQNSYFEKEALAAVNSGKIINKNLNAGNLTVQTLSSNLTLASDDTEIQLLAPTGTSRTVYLPAADAFSGMRFTLYNTSSTSTNRLLVDSGGILDVLANNQHREYMFDGTSWTIFNYGFTRDGCVALGGRSKATDRSVCVGYDTDVGTYGVALGYSANAAGSTVGSVALGGGCIAGANNCVALGGLNTLVLRNNEVKHSWSHHNMNSMSNLVLATEISAKDVWYAFETEAGDSDIIVPDSTAIAVDINIVCLDSGSSRYGCYLKGTGLIIKDSGGSFQYITDNISVSAINGGSTFEATLSSSGSAALLYVRDTSFPDGPSNCTARLNFTEVAV